MSDYQICLILPNALGVNLSSLFMASQNVKCEKKVIQKCQQSKLHGEDWADQYWCLETWDDSHTVETVFKPAKW